MSEDLRVVALLQAKPDEEEAVQNAILACVGPSRTEAGNLMYAAHTDSKDASLFVIVEHWENSEARNRHLQTKHFRELEKAVDESGKLRSHVFHVLHPL